MQTRFTEATKRALNTDNAVSSIQPATTNPKNVLSPTVSDKSSVNSTNKRHPRVALETTHSPHSQPIENRSPIQKKVYTCRKCGVPKKGHSCSEQESIGASEQTTEVIEATEESNDDFFSFGSSSSSCSNQFPPYPNNCISDASLIITGKSEFPISWTKDQTIEILCSKVVELSRELEANNTTNLLNNSYELPGKEDFTKFFSDYSLEFQTIDPKLLDYDDEPVSKRQKLN